MRICLVSSGLNEPNRRLQPWRYLLDAAQTLSCQGHEVRLISDGCPALPSRDELEHLPVSRNRRLQGWGIHRDTVEAVRSARPDQVLWHVGWTSLPRLRALVEIDVPVTGLLTSPIYRPGELLRLGLRRLLCGSSLSAVHLLGLGVPRRAIRRVFDQGWLQGAIVECETTRQRAVEGGVPADRVRVIRPAISPAWFEARRTLAEKAQVRAGLGLRADDVVVGYFGPPVALRGLPDVIRAVSLARERDPRIKLLALARQRQESGRAGCAVRRLADQLGGEGWLRLESGMLPRDGLMSRLGACDLVALPFHLVPSDVPLSVLEAMALGMPVIVTEVACLPELVGTADLCVPQVDIPSLAGAIWALAANKEYRCDLGKRARDRASEWCGQGLNTGNWNDVLG